MDKLTNQQYKFICELLWGHVPIDKTWATGTKLFQIEAPKILERYPQLDKSFYEEMQRDNS